MAANTMPYLPFLKDTLELVNSLLLLLKFCFERVTFLNTRLELADTSPRIFEFLLNFSLLLPYFFTLSILSLLQVLPVSKLGAKLGSFVLSKLEGTLEGRNLSIQSISFCGETSELGGCRRGRCRCVRMSLSKAPEIVLRM